ncbi:FkbM family methyltransferase [Butyrivibrio sp. JL13D10]|uniref:FkbM family methyltransferase n=1 Tax=Butyrivibrio sp. JL13D10 TaxID=3236815 RepID=UPI0038B64257
MFETIFLRLTAGNSDNEYYIYGLGTTGRLFADLCIKSQIEICAIVVGKGYRDVERYKGIPVIEYDNCSIDGVIFYSVKNIDLKHEINRRNKIIDISSVELYHELLNCWYKEFFTEYKDRILIKDDLIISGKLRIVNPQIVSLDDWNCFLQEAGDIILPEEFENYERIDEGAYKYDCVDISKGDVVIDAGANLGVFSAIAACKGAKKCYAFEPMTKNFQYLERQAIEYESIIPIKLALDKERRKTKISCNGSESSLFIKNSGQPAEEIECITLDEFAENNKLSSVDFIKADIEGAECNMILGGGGSSKEI